MRLKERIKTSLFFKIILLFLFAHLTIGSIGFTVHRFFKMRYHEESIIENMIHYSRFLSTAIGSPPDTSLARQYSEAYNIQVRIHQPGRADWTSESGVPGFDNFDELSPSIEASIQSGLIDGHFFIQLSNNTTTYLLGFDTGTRREQDMLELRILVMVLSMMALLTILYVGIRYFLRPIKAMDKAVSELSAGNLDIQLETSRRDELGELTRSFNSMTKRIKEMLQARDQLLLDASHELRSPLTRVKVALEFLEDDATRQTIQDDIIEMETMISELLESERLDSPYGGLHLKEVDINEILELVCAEQCENKPGIAWTNHPQAIMLAADPDRLKMAFSNLVQNAIKYSDPEGEPVQIGLQMNESGIQITIRDFGQGIPEVDIPFIFEPFYRVDKSRAKNTGGYGLGLSLTKKIIEAHQGKIEVKSTPGEGTEFIISFKLV